MRTYDNFNVKENSFDIPYNEDEYIYRTGSLECEMTTYGFTKEGRIVVLHECSGLPYRVKTEGERFTGSVLLEAIIKGVTVQCLLKVVDGLATRCSVTSLTEHGIKTVSRCGGKGVICKVVPDADIPIDTKRAELIMDGRRLAKR